MDGNGRSQSTADSANTRRKRWLMGAGILLTLSTLMVMGHGTAVQSALAAALADPAAILSARSPGSRTDGALAQTKNKRFYAKTALALRRGRPTERVLGQARIRPDVPVAPAAVSNPLMATSVAVPQGMFSDVVATAVGPVSGTAIVAGTPGFGIGGGGGSTGSGGGGMIPAAVVPEPSTWMMTILGFMTMGIGLRRRKLVARRKQKVRGQKAVNQVVATDKSAQPMSRLNTYSISRIDGT